MISHEDDLDRELATLTTWQGEPPELWKRALEAEQQRERQSIDRWSRVLSWSSRRAIAACIAVALLSGVVLTLVIQSNGLNREISNRRLSLEAIDADRSDRPRFTHDASEVRSDAAVYGSMVTANVYDKSGAVSGGGMGGLSDPSLAQLTTHAMVRAADEQQEPDRAVVRKATVDLAVDDVRAAFAKASHLVSEAGGEFVQESSITGESTSAQAQLTLRVAAERLSQVLNELRALGSTTSENTTGEDVTTQIVDLAARLRNEQRVETELLELLAKRQDAPLKEVLELHEQLGRIRQNIEQITAQRERLGRLVSLATVLVIIRHAKPQESKPQKTETLGAYFKDSIKSSFRAGVLFLFDTLAGLLNVVIGGLVWWIALLAAAIAVRQHIKRKSDPARVPA